MVPALQPAVQCLRDNAAFPHVLIVVDSLAEPMEGGSASFLSWPLFCLTTAIAYLSSPFTAQSMPRSALVPLARFTFFRSRAPSMSRRSGLPSVCADFYATTTLQSSRHSSRALIYGLVLLRR